VIGGVQPVAVGHGPVRVLGKSYIAQAGRRFTWGWGKSYVSGYKKLWGIK
jgi:hypothetical protein